MKTAVPTYKLFLSAILMVFFSCSDKTLDQKNNKTTSPLFEQANIERTNINFSNEIRENDQFNMVDYFYVYNGGGVSIGDLNNDGLPDIFFSGNMVSDALYMNLDSLKFKDVTKKYWKKVLLLSWMKN